MNMKHFITTAICLFMVGFAWGQTGSVSLHHDTQLDKLLFQEKGKDVQGNNNAIVSTGYRIQVYSSNAAKKAKENAFNLKKKLKQAFPEHHIYVEYQAPFWKVRLGDFTHYTDAVICSNQLKEAYPKLAGEIIIVKEKEVKPIYFEDYLENETNPSFEEEFMSEEE